MKNKSISITLFFLFSSLLSIQLFAQAPGSLDTGFGENGMVSYNWESLISHDLDNINNLYLDQSANAIWDAKLQPDGKILLLLSDQIIRLNPDGQIDFSFGGGLVQADNRYFSHFALQPDGKIVIVGCHVTSGNIARLFLQRLLPDGSADLTFGTASFVDSIGSQTSQGYPLIQPDGKIVVLSNKSSTHYWIGRFNSDGSIDGSFGQSGVKTIPVSVGCRIDPVYLRGHITNDGSILIANSTLPANNIYALYPQQYDLIKLKPNGSPDNSFSFGGLVHPGPAIGLLSGVLFAPDGKIIFFGQTYDGVTTENAHFIQRFLPSGSRDLSFGDLGLYLSNDGVTYFSNYNDISLARQNDGKLVLARGYPNSSTVNEHLPALFRLNEDGSADPTFGDNGRARIDYSNVSMHQIMALPEGRLIVAGLLRFGISNTYLSLPNDLFAARLFTGEIVATQNPNDAQASFQIDPNPCRNSAMLRFRTDCPEAASIRVFDPLGQVVLTENTESACTHRINTSRWAPGVYWVELRQGPHSQVKRLVKLE